MNNTVPCSNKDYQLLWPVNNIISLAKYIGNTSTILGTKPRLKEVLKELLPLAANWKIIGTLLDVEKHILDNIEANKEVLGSQNRLHEMLSEWQKQVTPSPTWDLLADAIEDFDKSKAQDIRDKCVKR